MGDIVYEPPRDGPTLWEIGIPDRKASEFFIPDPDPTLVNRVLVHPQDRFNELHFREHYCLNVQFSQTKHHFGFELILPGSGNMVCGRDTQICIQMMTLFTLLV